MLFKANSVPGLRAIQLIPSVEVSTVPKALTMTKMPSAKATELRYISVRASFQLVPFGEQAITPWPTATILPFPNATSPNDKVQYSGESKRKPVQVIASADISTRGT